MLRPKSRLIFRAARRAALNAFLLLVVGGLSVPAWTGTADARMRRDTLTLVTASGERALDVEIAETSDEKSLGLMFRTSLPDTEGMLFPHETPQEITMWMRNTYIPLDMVFIRADGVIHRIEARTEPMSERVIASRGNVLAVLEIAGGAAERFGLKPGDRVRYKIFKPKK
jgi:hypothetical protein